MDVLLCGVLVVIVVIDAICFIGRRFIYFRRL